MIAMRAANDNPLDAARAMTMPAAIRRECRRRDPNPVARCFIVADTLLGHPQPFALNPTPLVISTLFLPTVGPIRMIDEPRQLGLLVTGNAEQARLVHLAGPTDASLCPFLSRYQIAQTSRSTSEAQPPRDLFESIFYHALCDLLISANATTVLADIYRQLAIPRAPAAETTAEIIAQMRRTRRRQHGRWPHIGQLPSAHGRAVVGCIGAALLAIGRFEELHAGIVKLITSHHLNATLHVYQQSQ
jgi:hypothetical protein